MSIGIWQVLIVVVLVFLLFGAGRLPRVMEDIAKGIKSFKKGMMRLMRRRMIKLCSILAGPNF